MVVRGGSGISLVVLMGFGIAPVSAQDTPGRAPVTANGEVGQRQTVGEAAPSIKPTGRIQSRIQNRVQLRLVTRIDRAYSPQGNAASAITAASNRTRSTPK